MTHWYPRKVREQAQKLEVNGGLKFVKGEIVKQVPYWRECDLNPAIDTGMHPNLMDMELDLIIRDVYGICDYCIKLEGIRDIQEFMSLIKAKDSMQVIGRIVLLVFHGMKLLTVSVEPDARS